MAEALILRVAKLLDDFPEGGQLWGAGGELSELKKTVSFLQSIVSDAEKRSLREHREIGPWLWDVKDAFYDAEDFLEEWNLEVTRRESLSKYEKLKQQVITSFSTSKQVALSLEMSARAGEITVRLEAIAAEGRDLGLRECAEDVRVERRERLDSFVYDEEVIGREDDKSAIMNFLLDSDTDEPISVLSIVGMVGIGNTSLARCLYEDDMVKEHFDLRIWVRVGAIMLNLKIVLQKIIESATTGRAYSIELEQLQNQLKEHIRGKKYLLVFDGLRSVDPEQWESLKSLLMGGNQGSKILITTRDWSVVNVTGTGPFYCLEALAAEPSVDLLIRMACQEEEETINPMMVDIGRQIVKKCYGVPLAIRMIGSLLFFKKTQEQWSQFWGEIPEFSADYHLLSSIIDLSYNYLPCHLKSSGLSSGAWTLLLICHQQVGGDIISDDRRRDVLL